MCEFGSVLIKGGKCSPLQDTNIRKKGNFAFKIYEDARITVTETCPGKRSLVKELGQNFFKRAVVAHEFSF
jgi:hypothetical protein